MKFFLLTLALLMAAVVFEAGNADAAVKANAKPDFAAFERRAKAGEHLSVVFFGASLTWGANASDHC